MKIETTMFGEIETTKEQIINFIDGIPGFNDEKEFILVLNEDEENPLNWLQSTKTPELSFVIVNPFEIYDDYDFKLPEAAIDKLKIKDEKDVVVWTIVVVPEDITKITTNLVGPIIINLDNMKGKQIILEDDRYSTKHYLIDQELVDEKGGK